MARRPRTIGPTASDPGFSPQHALELVRSAVPPVHPAGRPFIGAGLALALAAASTENERTSLVIRTPGGADVVAVQVAGLLARRIICDAHVGDKLSIGDTYGLIRFGSRLDTYLPAGCEPLVKVGQRAIAGETVLAELP